MQCHLTCTAQEREPRPAAPPRPHPRRTRNSNPSTDPNPRDRKRSLLAHPGPPWRAGVPATSARPDSCQLRRRIPTVPAATSQRATLTSETASAAALRSPATLGSPAPQASQPCEAARVPARPANLCTSNLCDPPLAAWVHCLTSVEKNETDPQA